MTYSETKTQWLFQIKDLGEANSIWMDVGNFCEGWDTEEEAREKLPYYQDQYPNFSFQLVHRETTTSVDTSIIPL